MTEASRLAAGVALPEPSSAPKNRLPGKAATGRTWHSEPGSGLYVSIVLAARVRARCTLPVVTLALGLAAREAIQKTTGIACDLRWPNDVLIQSKKMRRASSPQLEGSAIIAGIGINVNHTAFPEELSASATSLRIAGGRVSFARNSCSWNCSRSVDSYCALASKRRRPRADPANCFRRASSYVSGRRV